MPEVDGVAEDLEEKLLGASEALVNVFKATGVEWEITEFVLCGDLRTVRGRGGLFGISRVRTAVGSESEKIALKARHEPGHLAEVAETEAMRGDVTEAETEYAQEMIVQIIEAKLPFDEWHRQDRERSSKLPEVGSAWEKPWPYWLGKALEAIGHPAKGRRSLTREALGWLRCAVAMLIKDEGD